MSEDILIRHCAPFLPSAGYYRVSTFFLLYFVNRNAIIIKKLFTKRRRARCIKALRRFEMYNRTKIVPFFRETSFFGQNRLGISYQFIDVLSQLRLLIWVQVSIHV